MHVVEANSKGHGSACAKYMLVGIMAATILWVANVVCQMEDMKMKKWQHLTVILTHIVLVLLLCHLDLIVPSMAVHMALVVVCGTTKRVHAMQHPLGMFA